MSGHSASGQNNPERCPLPKYDPDKQQLEEAFETFNRVSAELDASYQVLQARIGSLTEELVEARSQRLKELAEKERLANRLALLMDELPGGVVVADSRGVIREANHAATQFLGCDLVSKNWQEVLSGIKVGERSSGSELVLNNGRHLSVNSQYMSDANEEVILLTDMTRLYELQEIASRDERLAALGEMAARLAHQIRTPLSSALLFSGHIVHTGTSAEQRNRVVDKVMISLRHMESLVDTMLSFVRGAPPVLNVITISKLAEELVGAISPLVSSAGVTFRHDIEFDQPCLEGNLLGSKEALISAILNLVDNAIAMSSGKLILTLELIVNDNKLQISVADNGPGITADIQDQVFDPFFTTREKGTGLGLAVVAMTARSHGGSASVASTLGQGSVFTLELPLHKGSAPEVIDISQHQYFPADTKQAAISGAI
ncbi:MAG: PAS domain-containing sensor histidine kinase [Porticoccaceae bacterium]|nr:PAS domain-containing sensor histidine kinase [Porticoccaceae bacterium]